MDFYDEVLIKKRNEERKAEYNSLITGMYVGEALLMFGKKNLFENEMSIFLPENFVEMPEVWKKRKYPYESRPEIIYMNEDASVNFCFSKLDPDKNATGLMAVMEGFLIILRKINPSHIFLDQNVLRNNNINCAWCEIRGQSLDGTIYNILFIFELDNQLVLGTFNCPSSENKDWKRIVFKLIESISKEE